MTPFFVSHVDLRVDDRATATRFYDAFLPSLGLGDKYEGDEWTSYSRHDGSLQWFAFTEDAHDPPSSARIAFAAETHAEVDAASEAARKAGALNYEPPHIAFARCYSSFFEDPSGNKLEICCAAFDE